MAAITENGFVRPTYAQLLAGQQQRAKELFGSDIDTGELSVLGKFIRITVYDLAMLYEELEEVYFARFPGYAKGVQLDRLTPFAGVHRSPAVAAAFLVRFTGEAGAALPPGFALATASGLQYRTEEPLHFDENGLAQGLAVCTQPGTLGNLPKQSLSILVTPTAQVKSFTVLNQAVLGRGRETDAELRSRFAKAVNGIGSATAGAVKAAILRVPGVQSCTLLENDADETSPEGLPPHSFAAFVLGQSAKDSEIAEAIFAKKPMGIYSHGSTEVTVLDSASMAHTLRFSRVEELPVKVRVGLRATKLFPANGAEEVKQAVAARINALENGQSLVYSLLYPPVYALPGVAEVYRLELSADGGESYAAGNIPVSAEKALRCAAGDVEVEVRADGGE